MKILGVKVWVTIIATITAVIFITFSSIYPERAMLLLSIEVIILPAIYIIGNYCAEHLIKQEYSDLMKELDEKTEELNEALIEEQMDNIELSTILDMSFGVKDGKKK